MNGSESKNTFKPKQALPPSAKLYKMMVADNFDNMARVSLALLPEIPDGAIVHDNGCGSGAGSGAVLARNRNVSVKATDIDEAVLDLYRTRAAEGGWPAEASKMDSNALTFPNNTFTHSLASALIFQVSNDGRDTVKEMYRTLKPGGTAMVNSYAYSPNLNPIQNTALRTRPQGTPLPRQGKEKWHEKDFLKGVVEQGGFKDVRVEEVAYKIKTRTGLHEFATMLWSFVGGTGEKGWLESDEERWDKAIEVLKEELLKEKGFKEVDDGIELEFAVKVAIATK